MKTNIVLSNYVPKDSISAIPVRLLHRLIGDNIKNLIVEKETGIISPMLVLAICGMLADFIGAWKRIKNDFKLIK